MGSEVFLSCLILSAKKSLDSETTNPSDRSLTEVRGSGGSRVSPAGKDSHN